jgi:integrase
MEPKKLKNGKWKVDARPFGKAGKRFIREFKTRSEAKEFIKFMAAKAYENKEWTPDPFDNRKLSKLVDEWYDLLGHSLKAGEERKKYLISLCDLIGNPVAREFTSEKYLEFRRQRLDEGLSARKKHEGGIKASTCNHDLAYLKAVFNGLKSLGNWKNQNPLAGVKPIPLDDLEMAYLEFDDIDILLAALENSKSEHVLIVSKICLSTGCRWSEAQNLRGEQVRNCKITFHNTKSSKSRTVPISKELEKEILTGRKRTGPLFGYCYKAFTRALKNTSIKLPKGQATHVLRHTFASHFMMNDGNLLTLSKILGHSTIQMTMRYAHLSPEHLQDAIARNPLTLLSNQPAEEAA